ncbi:MAG: hypothetical protein J6W69_02145 [Bacteroidales bacterium]|nr:hypothetical protein [Bacteroidales bacterium]
MEELRCIIHYVRGLLAHPTETWKELSEPEQPAANLEYMQRNFYYPLLGVGTLLIFLLHGNGVMLRSPLPVDAPFSLEYALRGAVAFALSYFAGPRLASLIIALLCSRMAGMELERRRLEVFVSYNMGVLILCDMFCALLPNFTFLTLVSMYVLYVALEGVDNFMQIGRMRGMFAVISCVSIYLSPHVILYIFGLFR